MFSLFLYMHLNYKSPWFQGNVDMEGSGDDDVLESSGREGFNNSYWLLHYENQIVEVYY